MAEPISEGEVASRLPEFATYVAKDHGNIDLRIKQFDPRWFLIRVYRSLEMSILPPEVVYFEHVPALLTDLSLICRIWTMNAVTFSLHSGLG